MLTFRPTNSSCPKMVERTLRNINAKRIGRVAFPGVRSPVEDVTACSADHDRDLDRCMWTA